MSGTADAGKLLIQVEASTENLKRQLDQALAAVNSATAGMANSVKKVDTAFAGMGHAIEGAIGNISKFAGIVSPQLGEVTKALGAVGESALGLTAVGVAAFEVAKQVKELAMAIAEAGDEHKQLIAQLQGVTGSASQAEAAFEEFEASVLKTGISAQTSTAMFKQLSVATQGIGTSNKDVIELVKTIQNAGIAAGASSEQIQSVAQSLSVGFLQGSVNARQLRSILTEMPQLGVDIAEALGKPVSALMEMARHGKLTADVIQEGLLAATTKEAAKAAEMPLSLNRAWGELTGGINQFLAQMDKVSGISTFIEKTWHRIGVAAADAAKSAGAGTELEKVNDALDAAAKKYGDLTAQIEAAKTFGDPVFGKPGSWQKQLDDLGNQQAEQVALMQQFEAQKKELMLQAHSDEVASNADKAKEKQATLQDELGRKFDTLVLANNKEKAARKAHADAIKLIDEAEISGARDSASATAARGDADRKLAEELKSLNKEVDAAAKKQEALDKKIADVDITTGLAAAKAKDLYNVHEQGAAAIEQANINARVMEELHKAGIDNLKNLTAEEYEHVKSITANVTATTHWNDETKKLDDEQAKNKEKLQDYARELENTAKDMGKSISTALIDALIDPKKGQSFIDYFKNLFKKVASDALNSNIIMPLIRPVVNEFSGLLGVGQVGGGQQLFDKAGNVIGTVGGMTGGAPSGASAGAGAGAGAGGAGASSGGLMGSGSVLGSLFNVGSLANSVSGGSIFSGIGNSIGLTGPGGLFGSGGFLGSGGAVSGFLNTPIFGATATSIPENMMGSAAASQAFGVGTGATFGQALGGVGAGFAAGTLLNSALGGKQTGGMVGSAVGAIAGTAIGSFFGPPGMLIGGLIGGAAGGGLGGLIGPGPKHQAFGIGLTGAGSTIDVTKAIGSDTAALKAALDDATAQIAQLNAIMTATGVTVSGTSVIGKGNAVTQATSFGEGGIQQLQFAGPAGSDLATALAHTGGVVQSTKALTDMITFVSGTYEQLSKTAEKTNQYDDAIGSLNKTFADAIATAQSYGLATDKMSANLVEAVDKINKAHLEAALNLERGADVALLQAQGRTYEANVYGMGSGKQAQLDNLRDQLDSLGVSAGEAAPWVDKLSQAIDLQMAKVVADNKLARDQAEIQLQIAEATAAGNTAGAQQLTTQLNNAAALKNLRDTLTALGETSDEVNSAAERLTKALNAQAVATNSAQAAANALLSGLTNALATIFQTAGVGIPKVLTEQMNAFKVEDLSKSLTALGATTEQVTQWTDAYRNALAVQVTTASDATQRTLADIQEQLQSRQMQAEAGGATKETDLMDQAQKAADETAALTAQLLSLGTGAEETAKLLADLENAQGAERLAIIKKWNAQANAAISNTVGQSIQAYIDKLNATPAGGASPTDQFASAKAVFATQLTLAQGSATVAPDQTALSNITSNADALLAAAKSMFGSGQGYQDVLTLVKSSLGKLPPVMDYNAEILKALKALGGTINVNVSLAVIHSITETLNALPQADLDKLQVAATILHIVEEKLGRQLTVAEWDEAERVAGLNETVIQTVNQFLNGLSSVNLAQILQIAGLDPTISQQVVQSMQTLTKQEFEDIATVAGIDPTTTQSLEQKMASLTADQFRQIALVAGVDPAMLQHLTQSMGPLSKTEFDEIAKVAGIDPLVIQAVDQKLTSLSPADFQTVAKLANLAPAVTQTVTQILKALGTSDWQSLLKAQGYSETLIQSLAQNLSALTPDQFALIAKFPTTNTDVTSLVNQVLKTIGDAAINGDPLTKNINQKITDTGDPLVTSTSLTKNILQQITTTEAITVHISDTLDHIFQSQYLQLVAIATIIASLGTNFIAHTNEKLDTVILLLDKVKINTTAVAQNTGQLAFDRGRPQYWGTYALGAAFSGGHAIPFAGGGIFNQPTYAPMALFGEAGPEAIMPLKRDSSGRLGVSASASGNGGDRDDGVASSFAQVAIVLRDEIRLMRGDIQDVRATLRRAVAA